MSAPPSETTQALTRGYLDLHPYEAARLLESLPVADVRKLLESEPPGRAAKVLMRMNPDIASRIIEHMEVESFSQLVASLDPIPAAALLVRLDKKRLAIFLEQMPEKVSKEYQELMTYPPDTAGNLMDPRVLILRPDESVAEALTDLRAIKDRRIHDVCVVDEHGTLTGVITLQELAVADPEDTMRSLIREQPVGIPAVASRNEVVHLLDSLRLSTLPVVDIDGKLLGVIRYDALVRAATQDAVENLQAMVGASREERALSKASFAVRKRLPWLVVNLGTAFLASAVVGIFEETIAQITMLAIFLPVVAGQSGNTGSQALAVTLRGLALREIRVRQWPQVAFKELLVGFCNGCGIAVLTAGAVYFWSDNSGIAAVIGVSMVLSMVMAGLAGAVIPVLLTLLKQDPAQSSSIILTTVTDVAGFMSFLGLATLFSQFLI